VRAHLRSLGRRDLHALAGAYALDALDGLERERFERHLRRCRACESEVQGFAATAAALGLAAAAAPPTGLRERVLAAAAVTRQLPPLTGASGSRRAAVARRRGAAGTNGTFGMIPRVTTGIAAASLAAAAALAVVLVNTQHSLDASQARGHQIAAVLAAPDARLVTRSTAAGGTVTVVVSPREAAMVFTSDGLRALPSSQVYELWFLGAAGATRAGLVPTAIAGKTAPVLASGMPAGDTVGVTVEPADGTPQPTTKPIVVLPIPT